MLYKEKAFLVKKRQTFLLVWEISPAITVIDINKNMLKDLNYYILKLLRKKILKTLQLISFKKFTRPHNNYYLTGRTQIDVKIIKVTPRAAVNLMKVPQFVVEIGKELNS